MNSETLGELRTVLNAFPDVSVGDIGGYVRVTHGHINHSYKVETDRGYLFVQRINAHIFPDVAALSNQIDRVTQHLRGYYQRNNLPYEALSFYKTFDDNKYYQVGENFYRVCDFKSSLSTYQLPSNDEMVLSAGEAFAHFASGLIDLSTAEAYFPISRFHDLVFRYEQLLHAKQTSGKTHEVRDLLQICDKLFDELKPVVKYLPDGRLPSRWVHNDTKFNNLLFDEQLNARCVVDLDTVMPGSLIFDIGDALRTIGSTLEEDDPDTNNLQINQSAIDSFLKGYLMVFGEQMTNEEKEMIPYSGIYMSAIMGYRFLTDYLTGNLYYQVSYPSHNLDRARNQLTLALIFSENLHR